MRIDDLRPDPEPDDEFKEFQRLVLTAMGLPVTVGGVKIAKAKGVNFQKLYSGSPVFSQRPAYCPRDVYNKFTPECDSDPCPSCSRGIDPVG